VPFIDLKLFLLLCACVGGAVMYESCQSKQVLVETGNPWDVAIVGQGYFQIIDAELGEFRFTRTGKLRRGENEMLSIRVAGKNWHVEPSMNYFTAGWKDFRIARDGTVSIQEQAKNEPTLIGQFMIATFDSVNPFEDDFAINRMTDLTGQSSQLVADGSKLTILQGWLEQPAESAASRYAKPIVIGCVIAVVLKVLLDAVLAQQKIQKRLQSKHALGELQ